MDVASLCFKLIESLKCSAPKLVMGNRMSSRGSQFRASSLSEKSKEALDLIPGPQNDSHLLGSSVTQGVLSMLGLVWPNRSKLDAKTTDFRAKTAHLKRELEDLNLVAPAQAIVEDLLTKSASANSTDGKILESTAILIKQLRTLPVTADFEALRIVVAAYYCSPRVLEHFTQRYQALLTTPEFNKEISVAFRTVLRHACDRGETPGTIADTFSQIVREPALISSENVYSTISFLRGLVQNEWNIGASMQMLEGIVHNAPQPIERVLASIATSTLKVKPDAHFVRRNQEQILTVPPLLDYISIGNYSLAELDLADDVTNYCNQNKLNTHACTRILVDIFETCHFTQEHDGFEQVEREIRQLMSDGHPIEPNLRHLSKRLALSVENLEIRTQIESLIESSDPREQGEILNRLRHQYRGDILAENTRVSDKTALAFETQMKVTADSLSDFRHFLHINRSFPIIKGDLQDFPNGDLGLLSRFAYEMGCGKKLFCNPGEFAEHGLLISNLRPEALFQLKLEDPENWFGDYLKCNGWNQLPIDIDEVFGARFLITDSALAVSVPESAAYKFEGTHYSIIYFADHHLNLGNSLAFLVPTKILDSIIKGAEYDLLSLPGQCRGLRSLGQMGLTPDSLIAQSAKLGLQCFDVGCGSNLGGHSNALDPETSPYHRFQREDRRFAELGHDPWDHVLKREILGHSEVFHSLTKVHLQLHAITRRLKTHTLILENRLSAFKKGNTPNNQLGDELAGIEHLDPKLAGLRMLFDAYKWHLLLSQQPDAVAFPKLKFWEAAAVSRGPISNMWLDTETMELNIRDKAYMLPTPAEAIDLMQVNEISKRLSCSSEVANLWMLDVRPHLGALLPGFEF